MIFIPGFPDRIVLLGVVSRMAPVSEMVEAEDSLAGRGAGKQLFSQRMRAATKNIHNTSDAMVNAKLGVTMSDDAVWAEGGDMF